jgi:predicted deacylase
VPETPYPVELSPPDLSPYRKGNTGIDYVHSFRATSPGPHVLVNALTHGNEICGAIAVDFLFRHDLRPLKGTLTLSFANVAAYETFDAANPGASRYIDEDFNRVWTTETLDGGRQSAELARAREMRAVIDQADTLLDLHSMQTPSKPLMLIHGLDKERRLARQVGYPATVVCGPGHVNGLRMIEYAPFNDTANGKTALLVECGQHWQSGTATVAIDTALYFLKALGVVEASFADAHLTVNPAPVQRMLEVTDGVTARTDGFRFIEPFTGLEEIPAAGTVIATDGGAEITTPHDDCVLIMPSYRGAAGARMVRFGRWIG